MKKLFFLVFIGLSSAYLFAATHELNTWVFTKPPPGTPVNWGDPITEGLIFFTPMNDPGKFADIVKNKQGTASTAFPSSSNGNFSGPSSSYVHANSAAMDFGNILPAMSTFTVGVWVKSSVVATAGFDSFFFDLGHTGNTCSEVLKLWAQTSAAGKIFVETEDDACSGVLISSNTLFISSTTWQFIVVTRKGVTMNLYVNGKFYVTHVDAPLPIITPNSMCIGASTVTGSARGFMSGKIDHLFVYNRALSQGEIQQLYATPMRLFAPMPTIFRTLKGGLIAVMKTFGQVF